MKNILIEKAIVIDLRSRDAEVFMASTSCIPNGPRNLVLRKALEIGRLVDMDLPRGWEIPSDLPIIVMGRYNAQSSDGFTAQMGQAGTPIDVIGGTGFGWRHPESGERVGDGLRLFNEPIEARLLAGEGLRLERVLTHGNSNPQTAGAAWDGLRLMAENSSDEYFIAEGQSDWTNAWRIRPGRHGDWHRDGVRFPEEFRADIISPEKIIEKVEKNFLGKEIYYFLRQTDGEENEEPYGSADMAVRMYCHMARKGAGQETSFPEHVFSDWQRHVVENEIIEACLNDFKRKGFIFRLEDGIITTLSPAGNKADRGQAEEALVDSFNKLSTDNPNPHIEDPGEEKEEFVIDDDDVIDDESDILCQDCE